MYSRVGILINVYYKLAKADKGIVFLALPLAKGKMFYARKKCNGIWEYQNNVGVAEIFTNRTINMNLVISVWTNSSDNWQFGVLLVSNILQAICYCSWC